jgi:hypothetical protein
LSTFAPSFSELEDFDYDDDDDYNVATKPENSKEIPLQKEYKIFRQLQDLSLRNI